MNFPVALSLTLQPENQSAKIDQETRSMRHRLDVVNCTDYNDIDAAQVIVMTTSPRSSRTRRICFNDNDKVHLVFAVSVGLREIDRNIKKGKHRREKQKRLLDRRMATFKRLLE